MNFPTLRIRRSLYHDARYLIAAILMMCCAASPAADLDESADLVSLSLEELLNMEITTLSRKAEGLGNAPAAVFVISQKDIQRSGARTIPDLLRMVPGMQVAQIDGNKWAVTARGANGRFANKLLVLMDGRTLYSPLLSGVYWDVQDTDIDAIERIEVIRGPGATMWGANAVNGVVNIITKNAADTTGGGVNVLTGNNGRIEGIVRYGGKLGSGHYRAYAKLTEQDGNKDLLGQPTGDSSEMARIGSRADWKFDNGQQLSISAEAYDGKSGETRVSRDIVPPYETIVDFEADVSGAFARLHWSRDFGPGTNIELRSYVSHEDRTAATYDEHRDTIDIEFQHRFEAGKIHDVMWGLGYRLSRDDTSDSFEIRLDPASFTQRRLSGFIQDDIGLLDDRLRLVVGTKFEHTNMSDRDVEISPGVRLAYNVSEQSTIWGAVSRAVRVPSRGELSGTVINSILPPGQPELPLPVPIAVGLQGNTGFASEEVLAYEFGYRFRSDDLFFDVSVFFNEFNDIRSVVQGPLSCEPGGDSLLVNPACVATASYVSNVFMLENGAESKAQGAEVWVSKYLREWWHLQAGYTWYHTVSTETDNALNLQFEEDSPKNQVSLRSSMDLPNGIDLDVWLRYVDELKSQQIDDYTALDLRLAWAALSNLEFAVVGRNLLAGTHQEFISELGDLVPVKIEPEGYLELRVRF